MKNLLLILIIFSCKGKEPNVKEEISDIASEIRVKEMTDSIIKEIKFNALFDTVGLSKAPVKVLKSRLFTPEYSSLRSISLTYKNVSGKPISAIRFTWYGLNAFNKPADMGNYINEGFGGGFDDEKLRAGQSKTATFSISSRDGKKIVLAWPSEVAFEDGTNWKAGKHLQ